MVLDGVWDLPTTRAGVAAAVAAVRPHGLDLCSSVRQGGRLDPARLGAFFSALPAG